MRFIKEKFVGLSVFLILLAMFLLTAFAALGDSNIVDEIAHIPAGYSYVTTGDYRLNPEHPPIIKDLAAIPLVVGGANFPYDYWRANSPVINNQWEAGWNFIYRSGNNADALIFFARLPLMLLSVLFGFLVFLWSKKLYGVKAGLLAVALYAFNANIIAHSKYVATDLGISFSFFVNMFALYYYVQKPTLKRLILAGLSFGLVLLTKFSAAICVPVYFIVLIMLIVRSAKGKAKTFWEKINDEKKLARVWPGIATFLAIGVVGFLLMWGVYLFHTINMPQSVQKDLISESLPDAPQVYKDVLYGLNSNVVTKPLAQYFLGFIMVSSHVEGGHDAFLLGQVSNKGWWYYYPVAILIKTQIGLFALFLLLAFTWGKTKAKDWFTEAYLWVLPAVLLLMGMIGSLDIGIRYMLPIYPFAFVFISKIANAFDPGLIKGLFKKKGIKSLGTSQVLITGLIGASTVWYVLAGIFAYPHFTAYYNEFIGGYKNGYKYLTDSNTDWGQDVKRLSEWVDKNDIDKISVDVFPGPMPAKYYLGDKMVEWHIQYGRPIGYFAISATFYQNSRSWKNANEGKDYSWLDELTPVTNIGGSILVYKLN